MERKASASWQGDLKSGSGHVSTESNVLKQTPYSFKTRFESGTGTNPEELIAAAHAGCFTMQLSALLSEAGFLPERLQTEATLHFDKVDGSWTIKTIHLCLSAKVAGVDQNKLEEVANAAKAKCPVSRALKADITLTCRLEA